MKKVKFNNKGIEMAGHLFLPEKMESGRIYPSIVCASPAGSVKEQHILICTTVNHTWMKQSER